MVTAERDVFLPVDARSSAAAFVDTATAAESQGYDRVWMPETWGRDAVSILATIAAETEEIGIGSSIINVYARSPALIAQTAATLQELSDGRARIGLGPSGPQLVEGWHGVDYDRPLRRTRETIDIVREVHTGEPVTYDGDIFQLAGFRLRCAAPSPAPPIDAAGMGETSVELAGRFADGWHALMLTREGLSERLADLRRGADLGDRSVEDLRVTVSVPCCALPDRDRARSLIRGHIAFYVGAMGTFYREALAAQGYRETADEIAREWANGNHEAAAAAIDDELLDAIAVAGAPEACRERLRAFADLDGVDAVTVSFPRGIEDDELSATLSTLAPAED